MSCEDLTVIFQKLQICLLIFHQKSDEGADRNANSYNLIKKKTSISWALPLKSRMLSNLRQDIYNIVKYFYCISAKKA